MKRYSTLIVPPSFQWKVKLTMKLTYFSLFYGRPAINARIFRKVYVQLRPRDTRDTVFGTHNLTSNDKHVSLAAVSFTSDDYEDDYVIDPFFVTAAPLLIF